MKEGLKMLHMCVHIPSVYTCELLLCFVTVIGDITIDVVLCHSECGVIPANFTLDHYIRDQRRVTTCGVGTEEHCRCMISNRVTVSSVYER